MSFFHLLFYALLSFNISTAYELTKTFDATNLLNSFSFVETHDKYTHGCATYVSKSTALSKGLAKITPNRVYLGVDNTTTFDVMPQGGRKSVRLESHVTIDRGLLIADFEHLPANACGIWPAFWLLHDDEFEGDVYSEIDIIEPVSRLQRNEITTFTKPDRCTMTPQYGLGEVFGTDCHPDVGGCGVLAPEGTFGQSFNEGG